MIEQLATIIDLEEFEVAHHDPKWKAFCEEADRYVQEMDAQQRSVGVPDSRQANADYFDLIKKANANLYSRPWKWGHREEADRLEMLLAEGGYA